MCNYLPSRQPFFRYPLETRSSSPPTASASNLRRRLARNHSPQKAAESILAQHGKATDDALVLVARYLRDRP